MREPFFPPLTQIFTASRARAIEQQNLCIKNLGKKTVKKRNVKKPVKINNFVALNGKPNSQNSTKIAMKGERKNPGTRKNNQPVKDEIIIFLKK